MWQQLQQFKNELIAEIRQALINNTHHFRKWWFWALVFPIIVVGSYTGAYISVWHKELEDEWMPWIVWPTVIVAGIIMLIMEIRDRLHGNQV